MRRHQTTQKKNQSIPAGLKVRPTVLLRRHKPVTAPSVCTSTRAVARPQKPSSTVLLPLLPLRRRHVTRKGMLRLGEIALHPVHLHTKVTLLEVRLDRRSHSDNHILHRCDE